MLRCLAVDDEPLALSIIENFCSKIPYMRLVATASSGIESRAVLQEQDIDLLFLDINMPHITGVEFAKTLDHPPMIIFTTAYSDYALEGFQVSAVDYLVKPFSFERFFKAVNKAYELYNLRQKAEQAASETEVKTGFLMVKVDSGVQKIVLDDILYVEGLKDYIKIYTRAGNYITKSTMKNMEDHLPAHFMRIHKSFIVNLAHVQAFENNHVIVDQHRISLGNLYREDFFAFLNRNKL